MAAIVRARHRNTEYLAKATRPFGVDGSQTIFNSVRTHSQVGGFWEDVAMTVSIDAPFVV